jgi:signal transduction histidine kinase
VKARLASVAWVTTVIAAGIAIVITIGIPTGYGLLAWQYTAGSLQTQAEVAARSVEAMVMANPDTWQFEEIRLLELLQRHHDQVIPELRVILDIRGNVVASTNMPVLKPVILQRHDIYDAGMVVGQVEITRSIRPILFRTGLIGLASLMLGSCIFLIVRTVPLRAVEAEQRKAHEDELNNRQLQKAESLSLMAGAIAHHFNNLLGAIMGYLELAILRLPPESSELAYLTHAMTASRRAAEVSRLMLTYLGQTPGRQELLDVSAAGGTALSLLGGILPDALTMQTELPTPGPTVRANPEQLHQVIANLVTNAIEAIGEHQGVVKLMVKTVLSGHIPTGHRIPIGWQPQRLAYACIEVTDTGCGIEDRDIEKLFDPFYTTKFTGRGMGLSVVLGIVRAHGGCISVESRVGNGSLFRVFLPLMSE